MSQSIPDAVSSATLASLRRVRREGPPVRFLIVEGNTAQSRQAVTEAGGIIACRLYEAILLALAPVGSTCATVYPADPDGEGLPSGLGWEQIDAIVCTGSALSVYWDRPEVHRQIALTQRVFESGRPYFGSCWALQVAAVVAGGTVAANPRGREVGLARKITLTAAGRDHPLHRSRPLAFDAVAIHGDEVSRPPAGMTILAGNAISPVQSAEIRYGNGVFWGVQYHPEFDLQDVGALCRRYQDSLLEDGLAAGPADLLEYAAALDALGADPARRDLAWRLGVDSDVLAPCRRLTEIMNWMDLRVLPWCQTQAS